MASRKLDEIVPDAALEIAPEFADTSAYAFPEDVRRLVRDVSRDVESEIQSLLPSVTQRVELLVTAGTQVIPEIGSTASSVTPRLIVYTVDPARPEGVVAIVRANLRSALFHELHHVARGWVFYGGEPQETFIDGVVCEGLATAFERDAARGTPPWGEYPSDVESWVTELLGLPPSAPYDEWMFMHPDGRRWVGYRAGTFIVDQAITRSGLSAAQLVDTPTDEILKLAGLQD